MRVVGVVAEDVGDVGKDGELSFAHVVSGGLGNRHRPLLHLGIAQLPVRLSLFLAWEVLSGRTGCELAVFQGNLVVRT